MSANTDGGDGLDGEVMGPVEDDVTIFTCDRCGCVVNGEPVFITTGGELLCQGCDIDC